MFMEGGFYNAPVNSPSGVYDYGHGISAVDSVYDRREQTAIHLLIEDGRAAITVLKLAETIVRLAGSDSKIVFRDLPVDDPKQRRPDITRARKLIGWEPEVGLEDGLRRTLEYFRQVV